MHVIKNYMQGMSLLQSTVFYNEQVPGGSKNAK